MTDGTKHDGEKIRMDLLPFEALEAVAQALTYGARKYSDNGWQTSAGQRTALPGRDAPPSDAPTKKERRKTRKADYYTRRTWRRTRFLFCGLKFKRRKRKNGTTK